MAPTESSTKNKRVSGISSLNMLLMHLYCSHLNPLTPLDINDPSLALELGSSNGRDIVNPLDRLAPSSKVPPNELEARTTKVREKLYDAIFEQYFQCYHPVKAYHKGTKADLEKKWYLVIY
jgi:hypothetical protein